MKITESERADLETALDVLWEAVSDNCDGPQLVAATQRYCRAIAIVRECPAGERRVRSDFLTRRATPQGELKV